MITYTPTTDEYGPKFELRFAYNPDIVAAVKLVKHRRYTPESKTWTIPQDQLSELRALLPGVEISAGGPRTESEAVANLSPLLANDEIARLLRLAADRLDAPPY